MSQDPPLGLTRKMRLAVNQLQDLIRDQHPQASFRVVPSPENAGGIDIWASVDLDDPDELMDLVVEKVMELQIEEGLPVHVVPLRTPERVGNAFERQVREPHLASHVPTDIVAL